MYNMSLRSTSSIALGVSFGAPIMNLEAAYIYTLAINASD